jgi:hypothetical protein
MARVIYWGIGCVASAILSTSAAVAQLPSPAGELAPVPRQVLTARAVLIANGASETYGADSYYRLTKYDGGPNRAYDSFYNEVKSWNHYSLVGETADADVVLVVKFTNPVVDRMKQRPTTDQSNDWIYDPQLNLSINDPRTGLPLWTITEHIEPGGERAEANQRYDDAVVRLVDDLKRLVLRPDLRATTDNPPPGAVDVAIRQQRQRHAAVGMLIGVATGAALALSQGSHDPCPNVNQFSGCVTRTEHQAGVQVATGLGMLAVGALVGWFWPVSY